MGIKEFWSRRAERRLRIRRKVERWFLLVAFLGVAIVKPFPFLHFLLIFRTLRNVARYWTWSMIGTVLSSWGRRFPADQPSSPRVPTSFAPRAEVEEPYRLSESQIRSFFENGFLGPVRLCSPEEMEDYRKDLERLLDTRSSIYGIVTGRDRHLDSPILAHIARLPALARSVAQLMGPDLLLWRTQLLAKPPLAPETAWHQVSTFTCSGKPLRPVLEPPDINELFNVTVWLAVDKVDTGNGCMQFLRGSHRLPLHTIRLGEGQAFGKATFQFEADIDPERVVDMELQPGECVIFHERTLHAARPNVSATRRRFGINFRVCQPDVYVYRGMRYQEDFSFLDPLVLDNWGVVLLHGEDRFHRNRYAQWATEEAKPSELTLSAS